MLSDTENIGIGVAAGAVAVIVILVAVGIAVLIWKKFKNSAKDPISEQHGNNNKNHNDAEAPVIESPDMHLIDEEGGDDSSITFQNVLDDDIWIDDMSGVMNHCIPILKGCHDLTSRLVPITMKECSSPEENKMVEETALKVQPRLEDVVQLLEGPLEPRLVEARCTALYYAVSNLCLVVKGICKDANDISDWMDASLMGTENHLKILQAETQKLHKRSLSGSVKEREECELSLNGTHSRGGSSHTDSTESGIDVETPSERGSTHNPHSPSTTMTFKLKGRNQMESDIDSDRIGSEYESDNSKLKNLHQCSTIVEVHTNGDEVSGISMEMKSFTNNGYSPSIEERC